MARPDPLRVATVAELVAACGGPVRLGRELGINPSAVSNWSAAGAVPDRWHARMLVIATRINVLWRPPGWPPQMQIRWNDRILDPAA